MPISHKARSCNCGPRFLVGSNSNRYAIPFHKILKPSIRGFESLLFSFVCVFFFCHLFQHFCLKVRTRNWYANLTKFPNLTNKFFFRSNALLFLDILVFRRSVLVKVFPCIWPSFFISTKKRKMQPKGNEIRERARKRMKGL